MLSHAFDEALAYALEHHRTQLRKGTDIPYVSHLLQVTGLVLEYGGGEDAAMAAALHDAIEDAAAGEAGRVRREIDERFGAHVLDVVDRLTDADVQPKPPWRPRKEAYLAHLADETDPDVLLVSCCDKLHNARQILSDYGTIGEDLWDRFAGGREGTLWYYRALTDTYRSLRAPGPVTELEDTVEALERRAAERAGA